MPAVSRTWRISEPGERRTGWDAARQSSPQFCWHEKIVRGGNHQQQDGTLPQLPDVFTVTHRGIDGDDVLELQFTDQVIVGRKPVSVEKELGAGRARVSFPETGPGAQERFRAAGAAPVKSAQMNNLKTIRYCFRRHPESVRVKKIGIWAVAPSSTKPS